MLYKEFTGSSMLLGILTFLSALTISAVAIYYSVAGLAAIFAAAVIPIIIMGVSLEVGKLVTAVWLHRHWSRATWWLKTYLSVAVFVLMFITSMGIFGFLSKAHIEQTSMSQEQVALIETIDGKIIRSEGKIERWTTEMDRLLAGEDIRVDSLIDREQIELDKINALIKAEKDDIRKDFDKQIQLQNDRLKQAAERKEADIKAAKDRFEGSLGGGSKYDKAVEKAKANELSVASSAQKEIRAINSKLNEALASVDTKYANDIKAIQDRIQDLRGQANAKTEDLDARITELEVFIDKEQVIIDNVREEKFEYEKTYRQLEAEVGPIKYIAEFIYGENADQNLLEAAVRWVIIIIIFVFDPLAVLLLIASQYTFQFVREDKGPKSPPKSDPDPDEPDDPVEEKFEDVSEEELAEEERRELEQLRAEKIALNVAPSLETGPKVKDAFDPDEVEYELQDTKIEEFKKREEEEKAELERIAKEAAESLTEEEPKKNPPEYFGEDEYVPNENIKEEAQDLDKWNKWVEAAEEEVAKEDGNAITGIGAVKGSFKQAEEELQKKTEKGSNYITKVSNKQIRQQTNPEDSDQT